MSADLERLRADHRTLARRQGRQPVTRNPGKGIRFAHVSAAPRTWGLATNVNGGGTFQAFNLGNSTPHGSPVVKCIRYTYGWAFTYNGI